MNFKIFYFKNKMLVWSLNLAWLMILIHEVCIINKMKFYMIITKGNTKNPTGYLKLDRWIMTNLADFIAGLRY